MKWLIGQNGWYTDLMYDQDEIFVVNHTVKLMSAILVAFIWTEK